jgi:hypothetical protein
MAEPSHPSVPPSPGRREPGDGQAGPGRRLPGDERGGAARAGLAALAVLAVIAGTALLGAATGLVWAAVAPRALAEVIGRDSANLVNPEASAFIAADGWFTLLTAVGGVISGLLGYVLAVRRQGPLAMAGVLAGALAATLIARWIGQDFGVAAYNHILGVGRPGALVHVPLALGGYGPLAFWPLIAGLTAGAIELSALLRERRQRATLPLACPPPGYGPAAAPAGPYGYAGHDRHPGRPGPGPGPGPAGAGPSAAGPRAEGAARPAGPGDPGPRD